MAILALVSRLFALRFCRCYPMRRSEIYSPVPFPISTRPPHPARLAWWSADEPPSKDEHGKEKHVCHSFGNLPLNNAVILKSNGLYCANLSPLLFTHCATFKANRSSFIIATAHEAQTTFSPSNDIRTDKQTGHSSASVILNIGKFLPRLAFISAPSSF